MDRITEMALRRDVERGIASTAQAQRLDAADAAAQIEREWRALEERMRKAVSK